MKPKIGSIFFVGLAQFRKQYQHLHFNRLLYPLPSPSLCQTDIKCIIILYHWKAKAADIFCNNFFLLLNFLFKTPQLLPKFHVLSEPSWEIGTNSIRITIVITGFLHRYEECSRFNYFWVYPIPAISMSRHQISLISFRNTVSYLHKLWQFSSSTGTLVTTALPKLIPAALRQAQ